MQSEPRGILRLRYRQGFPYAANLDTTALSEEEEGVVKASATLTRPRLCGRGGAPQFHRPTTNWLLKIVINERSSLVLTMGDRRKESGKDSLKS